MNKSFGRNREYEQHLEGKLPKELEHLRHSIEWPIDPNNEHFHLAYYFLETREGKKGGNHSGIDIHVPAQTPIYAPENGRIVLVKNDARDDFLGDIILYSHETGIAYTLAHVQFFNLPPKIRECKSYDVNSPIMVKKGEEIASVGYWPFENKNYNFLPEDIRAKKEYYCHLHFATEFCPDISQLREDMNPRFNPLMALNKL